MNELITITVKGHVESDGSYQLEGFIVKPAPQIDGINAAELNHLIHGCAHELLTKTALGQFVALSKQEAKGL